MAQSCGGGAGKDVSVDEEMRERRLLKLKSCEGQALEMKRDAALLSGFLKDVLNFTFCTSSAHEDAPIPISFCFEGAPGADAHTLSKVIDYFALPKIETDEHGLALKDTTYIDGLGGPGADSTLFKVMMTADYMNVEGLLDLCCEAVADVIRHKSVEEIRELFNIQNDLDPTEEEAHRQSYAWAYEGDDEEDTHQLDDEGDEEDTHHLNDEDKNMASYSDP